MDASEAFILADKIHAVYRTERQWLNNKQNINKILVEYLSIDEYASFCRLMKRKMKDYPVGLNYRTFKKSFHKNHDNLNKGVWDSEIVMMWGVDTLLLIISDIVSD